MEHRRQVLGRVRLREAKGNCTGTKGAQIEERRDRGRGSWSRLVSYVVLFQAGSKRMSTHPNTGSCSRNVVQDRNHVAAFVPESACVIAIVQALLDLPFVTLLSKLGLKPSPEKSEMSSGCP